jgi:hypothetical protein
MIAKLVVLDQERNHIHAKPIHAAVEPKAHHVEHGGQHVGMTIVQVGLLFDEGMHIVLPGGRIIFPSTAAKSTEPVVRRAAIGRRVAPDVPIPFRIAPAAATRPEPGVLVGRVIRHQIENHLQPASVGLRQQLIKIRERAEYRIDPDIVGHVVAKVNHRRRIDRRKPKGGDSETGDIIETPYDAGQIPDSVAVTVLKAARVDLVNDASLPPRMLVTQS